MIMSKRSVVFPEEQSSESAVDLIVGYFAEDSSIESTR